MAQSSSPRNTANDATENDDLTWKAVVQQERLARHLGDLVEQAETQAAAERREERLERSEQQTQLLQSLREMTAAALSMAEGSGRMREQMETLQSEVRTLRAAILLAHSIGREGDSQSPLGMDVAQGPRFDPFDPFQIPAASSGAARRGPKPRAPGAAKRTRNLSPEARERISSAQKARWAAHRAAKNQ